MMKNAKDELLMCLKGLPNVKCAIVEINNKQSRLIEKYNTKQWSLFLEEINLSYDNSADGNKIYGYVWLEDGTWIERELIGDQNYWIRRIIPSIPWTLRTFLVPLPQLNTTT